MRILAVLSFALLGSCYAMKEHHLPAFDAAMARPADGEPPVVLLSDLPVGMPEFTAYARLDGEFHPSCETVEEQARVFRDECVSRKLGADFVLIEQAGQTYVGTVGYVWGFGVMTASNVYRPLATGWCCRYRASRHGIRTSDSLMVTMLSEEARASGIQEGDTLVSIAGVEVPRPGSQDRTLSTLLMDLPQGSQIAVVWIRPGTGRMSGTVIAAPQPARPTLKTRATFLAPRPFHG